MMKRSKKVVSAATVSAILAAQAVMSAAAAGGSINVDMSTKSPILRVNVPTKMAVSVNEFEMGDEGSQITSGEFTMKNMSELPVTVKVSSEATVGTDTVLVSTKQAAQDSTDATNPAMWLAAVAAVAENGGTLEYATGTDKTVAGLEGTEANITAFGTKDATSNKSTVDQTFYLQATTAPIYKGITGTDVDKAKTEVGGADFYELTELTSVTDAASAETEAATKDIYKATAAPAAGAPATFTKIAKGTKQADITINTGDKLYSIGATPVATASMVNTNKYLYIDGATTATGDAAAFRYIGALSGAKSGWSTTDLSAITITYDIAAISGSAYTEVAGADGSGLTYGYKTASSRISVSSTGLMSLKGVNSTNWKGGVVVLNGSEYAIGGASGTWVDATSDPATFQFADAWVNNIKGKEITVKVTLKDDSVIEETITVPAS